MIRALGAHAAHVPYRDSTLTQLLRSGLMGHTRTALVVNVASEAEHADETICSLGYNGAMAHALMQRAEDGPSGAASGPYSAARFQVELVHLARQSRSFSAADCLVAGWRSVPVDFVGAVRALVAVHTSCRVASSSRELGISSSRVLRLARPRCRRSSSLQPLALETVGSVLCDSWQLRDPRVSSLGGPSCG